MKKRSFITFLSVFVLFAAAATVLLSSCYSSGGGYAKSEAAYMYDEPMAEDASGMPAPRMSAARSSNEMPAEMEIDKLAEAEEMEDSAAKPEPQQQRKKIYSGDATLVVDDVDIIKDQIADTAEKSGGYVEYSFETTVIIRVPAGQFDEIFAHILAMGDVEFKSIETVDVTDFFFDMQTRLELNTKTRERLYTLLQKTDDVDERVKILREIRRLTEEIERIQRSLELLEGRIAYSRISLELIPRLPVENDVRSSIPFSWIANLNPLYSTLGASSLNIDPDMGDDFAVFSSSPSFRAESPEGTRVRIGGTRNEPEGDGTFWQRALVYHLSPLYRSAEEMDIGPFSGVLFESKDAEPFYYYVGVSADSRESGQGRITVLELFFPDDDTRVKRLDTVSEVIEEAGGTSDE